MHWVGGERRHLDHYACAADHDHNGDLHNDHDDDNHHHLRVVVQLVHRIVRGRVL